MSECEFLFVCPAQLLTQQESILIKAKLHQEMLITWRRSPNFLETNFAKKRTRKGRQRERDRLTDRHQNTHQHTHVCVCSRLGSCMENMKDVSNSFAVSKCVCAHHDS